MQVQARAEPEEVLEAVAQGVPARLEVDELDATLHDVRTGAVERTRHLPQQPGVHLVLGVEDAYDVTSAIGERRVERTRLVLRPRMVDHDPDPSAVSARCGLGHLPGARVVVADDGENLEGRVVEFRQLVQRGLEHGFLVPGGHDEREAQR